MLVRQLGLGLGADGGGDNWGWRHPAHRLAQVGVLVAGMIGIPVRASMIIVAGGAEVVWHRTD